MRCRSMVGSALAFTLMPLAVTAQDEPAFTDEFPVADCEFETEEFDAEDANPYFILQPGRQLHFNNFACVALGECDEVEEVIITVLNRTRNIKFKIDGKTKTVTTRIVEERETADGELTEISRNFFAECNHTQDVYYFGERVDDYEDGVIVSHGGAWLAGEKGAQPGIIFPGGAFLLGARYFQEVAPGVALDRAVHADMDLEVEVPAGSFEDCVAIEETTPLDPEELSEKVYCPGTGLVIDDDLELTAVIE
jgi:hypothetical protein